MAQNFSIRGRFASCLQLGGLLLLITAAFALPKTANAAERIALVIGNAGYRHLNTLDHATNDMLVMADTLRSLDFEVEASANLDRPAMLDRLEQFGRRIDQAGEDTVGVLFYAGHGLQFEGSNYLLPIDADIDNVNDVEDKTINLDLALAEIAFATNDTKLVILDVPATNSLAGTPGTSPGLGEIDAPVGTLVAFGALPGALEGDQEPPYAGLYPLALANALIKPGLQVEQVFQEVRLNVAEATDGVQIPWESSSLDRSLYLNGTPEQEVADLGNDGGTTFTALDPRTVDLVSWTSIKESTDEADFANYLNDFPDGIFRHPAERRLAHLTQPDAPETAPAEANDRIVERDERLITQRRSNIRAEPSSNGVIIATVEPNQEIQITGEVVGQDWYRMSLATGVDAYIWAPLLDKSAPPADNQGGLVATLPPSKHALLGQWQGQYQCQWDTIGMTLEIVDDPDLADEQIGAIFSFFPLPGMPSHPSGSFDMIGSYDADDGTIALESQNWIQRPFGLQTHNMIGRADIGGASITGRIETTGCTDFVLSRDGGQGLPTAQSVSNQ